MLVFTDVASLRSEEVSKSLSKGSDKVVVFCKETDQLPIDMVMFVSSLKNVEFAKITAGSDFEYGFAVGSYAAKSNDKIKCLFANPEYNTVANQTADKPASGRRSRKTKTAADSRTDSGEDVEITQRKSKRGRKKKVVEPVSEEPVAEKPVAEENVVEENVVEEVMPAPEDKPVEEKRTCHNKALERILNDESLSKRLKKAVKDSSDPKIGLEQLLKVHFGALAPLIIDDVRAMYEQIKAE